MFTVTGTFTTIWAEPCLIVHRYTRVMLTPGQALEPGARVRVQAASLHINRLVKTLNDPNIYIEVTAAPTHIELAPQAEDSIRYRGVITFTGRSEHSRREILLLTALTSKSPSGLEPPVITLAGEETLMRLSAGSAARLDATLVFELVQTTLNDLRVLPHLFA
jgi:hypothetical protein